MSSNKLKLSLVLVATVLSLVACDKSARKAAALQAPGASTDVSNTPAASVVTPDAAGKAGSVREACADDIKKFCAGAEKPGHCLKEHEAQLSQACIAARAARKAARQAEQSKQ